MNECATGNVSINLESSSSSISDQNITFSICDSCKYLHPRYVNQSTFKKMPYRCPVCEGRGNVPNGFYSRMSLATDTSSETCKACSGSGIIWA